MHNKVELNVTIIDVHLDPKKLAIDIDRDCAPEFKIQLVTELFDLDPTLRSEIMERVLYDEEG